MLELHHVTIGQQVCNFSLIVGNGKVVGLAGVSQEGRKLLLRAVFGMIPIDNGHISIDGELLTPLSAPFFRRQTAYVPQQVKATDDFPTVREMLALVTGLRVNGALEDLQPSDDRRLWNSLPEGERFVLTLRQMVAIGKPLLVADEPTGLLDEAQRTEVDTLLAEAARKGAAVLFINGRNHQDPIQQ